MRERLTYGAAGVLAALVVLLGVIFTVVVPVDWVLALVDRIDASFLASALRRSVPIAFAALGGIYAEKSGVINIGLEGLLIVATFTSVFVAWSVTGSMGPQSAAWVGFAAAIVVSTLMALLFAVITIEYEADQIIAGLAVWLVALGLAPFASQVVWNSVNSPGVPTLNAWAVPLLADVPVVGPALFDALPTVYMMLVAVPLSWYVLNRTAFGRWVRASGENPKALDTAGVNVDLVRYVSVLLSGVCCGIGGAGLAVGQVGSFTGSGQTMVSGRGWIGITAYLFGNYNPFGAFGASLLFTGLEALQVEIQSVPGIELSPSLVQMTPFVVVIVVLALVGRTRIPEAAGEHYTSEED